jgi:hypothetical protein
MLEVDLDEQERTRRASATGASNRIGTPTGRTIRRTT